MKKLLITVGSLLVLTIVVVLFVNASGNKKETGKSGTSGTETMMPCSATCGHSSAETPAECDPAACAGTEGEKCDPAACSAHKDGKCDPVACPEHKKEASTACTRQTSGCASTCSQALK